MARLAIVSTYNENCGNASYTHVLKKAFAEHVEVDVIPLDLFLIQKKGAVFRKAATQHFRQIAERLKTYDYVNIQFEAGLYGSTNADRLRHIKILIDASPNLTLTMHRIDVRQHSSRAAWSSLIFSRSYRRFKRIRALNSYAQLYQDIVEHCKLVSKEKNIWIKVHTKRERRIIQEIYGFSNCFDYPLVFLNKDEKSVSWSRNDRETFIRRHRFDDGDKIIGLFGYISGYKGIETALKALSIMPPQYKLALFGSQHPQTIKANTEIDPFLKRLLVKIDDLGKETSRRTVDKSGVEVSDLDLRGSDFLKRVRFVGTLDDPEFIEALRLCDVVVLPYLEVGQSMSGVVVLAMEAGARMLCANNLSFMETSKYFGNVYSNFDIGNYAELAQKAIAISTEPKASLFEEQRHAAFSQFNIENSVLIQLKHFGFERI